MDVALPERLWRKRSPAIRSLETWLLCWIFLPNIAYWLISIVGGPSRPIPILFTGLAGIICHRAPFAVKFAFFLAAMIFSALFFIAASFNLSILSLVHSLQFAAELSPSASSEYVVAALLIAATLAGGWWLLRRSTLLTEPSRILLAAAATLLAISFDHALAEGARGSYKRVPDAGAPFTSAASASGLATLANGDRHVMVVMVEAMGQPVDPALRERLVDIWARPEVRARYTVTTGDTLFYGSTTSGEVRELCGRWGDYPELIESDDPTCLPATLAARGYRTSAWHSFNGRFFDRSSWYPRIGFQEMRFGPDLERDGARWCPGVFPGACDRDVPSQLATRLKQAREPQFLYWLTVNTHLPVLRDARLETEQCSRFDAALDREFPMACRLLQLFDQTGRALASEIAAADFPATDILIVGDHLPPFFDRQHRSQFEPDRVPWILLRPKVPGHR